MAMASALTASSRHDTDLSRKVSARELEELKLVDFLACLLPARPAVIAAP
jgi:hypothetical protein